VERRQAVSGSVYDRRMASDVAAFILAGGKSTRMGTDKAFVMLDGRTLLARALDVTRSVAGNARIVGNSAKFAAFAPVVHDIFQGCGPLGGIHAALRATHAELNLIHAVDVPFVTEELLAYLIKRARNTMASVTVPRVGGRWQSLCAVYRLEFADFAEKALRTGRYKIDALFDQVPVQAIDEEELEGAGFSAKMFRNLNTPEELTEAARN
jgi:molybdenum cofactor guanylyltransferase